MWVGVSNRATGAGGRVWGVWVCGMGRVGRVRRRALTYRDTGFEAGLDIEPGARRTAAPVRLSGVW